MADQSVGDLLKDNRVKALVVLLVLVVMEVYGEEPYRLIYLILHDVGPLLQL